MSEQIITLAAGCFWCTEAIFKQLKGVTSVVSGYSGGYQPHPNYEQVTTGTTGHAEAIQITFDPEIISLATIFDIFWLTHDPTTMDQQGADIGSQYRSVIFYHTSEQKQLAEQSKQKLVESGKYQQPIVTQIVPFEHFYPAEKYHQNYYQQNQDTPYCQIVIEPKLTLLMKKYRQLVE